MAVKIQTFLSLNMLKYSNTYLLLSSLTTEKGTYFCVRKDQATGQWVDSKRFFLL